MNKVYIVRHGETKWNKKNIHQGKYDSPLTQEGILTAKQIAKSLKKEEISYIFTSPLGRARQTSQILGDVLQTEIVPVPEFEEIDFGILEGRLMSETQEEYKDFFNRRSHDVDYKIHTPYPNGESYQDLFNRIRDKVANLVEEHKNFIIVGHTGLNRVIRAIILDVPLETAVMWRQKNNEYVEIDLDNRKEKIIQ